jgi:hypothetical protein
LNVTVAKLTFAIFGGQQPPDRSFRHCPSWGADQVAQLCSK